MENKQIGQLNEHSLHLSLKRYLEPDTVCHERAVGEYVVDILNDGGITEIETRSFSNMAKKLPLLLREPWSVTVVYPILQTKWILEVDGESGTVNKKRRSPKKGRPSDVISELYKLRAYLTHPQFTLKLLFLEVEEYKKKGSRTRWGKGISPGRERVPVAILGERTYHTRDDYATLIELPSAPFTAKELSERNGLKGRASWYALQLLLALGVITQSGTRGKAFLYAPTDLHP